MPVIWGLDLSTMTWGHFKSSYMFGNTDYHLRRTKFAVYQGAMIFCVISESIGTAVLSDYTDQQNYLESRFPGVNLFNDDYVGIASFNIAVGVLIATVFGAGFFFDLFFPDRYEPRWVKLAWQGSAIFMCIAGLADALAFTCIVGLRSEGLNSHIKLSQIQSQQLLAEIAAESNKTPLLYRDSGRAIASVVFLWIGLVFTFISTYVMIAFYRHVSRTGTAKAQHLINNEKFGNVKDISDARRERQVDPVV